MTPDATQPAGTLYVTDRRTGRIYEPPIVDGAIQAIDLRQIKVNPDDFGLMTYDPGYMNTAALQKLYHFYRWRHGHPGYRGYPIEELAERARSWRPLTSSSMANCPTRDAARPSGSIKSPTTRCSMRTPRSSWMDSGTTPIPWACSSAPWRRSPPFTRNPKHVFEADVRRKQIFRLIAKVPTVAAFAYRHITGMPFSYPDNDLSYTGNFLNMLFKRTELKYQPEPGARSRPGRPVHPARRPRAELLHQFDAHGRQRADRSVLLAGRLRPRPCTGRCTAAPTRPSCGC